MRQNASASPHAKTKLTGHVWPPNITGDSDNGGESNKNYSPVGAFYSSVVDANTKMAHEAANDTNLEVICIDASRVSNIYNGTKLQPSALQTLACIRV